MTNSFDPRLNPHAPTEHTDSATLLDRLIHSTRTRLNDVRMFGVWIGSRDAYLEYLIDLDRDLASIWAVLEAETLAVGRSESDLYDDLVRAERTIAAMRPYLPVYKIRALEGGELPAPSRAETVLRAQLDRALSLLTPQKRQLFDTLTATAQTFDTPPVQELP